MKRIGIDIGGTFTDIVIIDEATGELTHDKFPSTPKNPEAAIISYFNEYMPTLEEAQYIIHGTTVATNAVIERKGARLGLITNLGQKDRLDIQRSNLLTLYDWNYQKPQALIPLRLRREVTGRTLYDGSILAPIDEAEVLKVGRELVEDNSVEGICVCLLNSYVNPEQELQIKESIKQKYPETYVMTSSEALAEFLEYERFSTTIISAFLMPVMDRYLAKLEDSFAEKGLPRERFMLMQGNGGIMGAAGARQQAALTVESGPSAGVASSQYIGSLMGRRNLITFDMGGTSTDVCLIRNEEPYVTLDYKVAGHAMRFPLIDIHSIGAGGGSIAWIDEGGGLHVGPRSAGADPGPACYGKGGGEPTVSDAHAILGRLLPDILLGDKIKVRPELADKAMSRIASYYKMNTVDTAAAIIKIVNENMVNALRVISTQRGVDPSDFTLIAYGGAGPLHAGMMMKQMRVTGGILPPVPGNHSALGLISSDIKHDYVQSVVKRTSELDIDWVNGVYQSLEEKGREALRAEQVQDKDIQVERGCDMRYVGQAYVPCIIPFAFNTPRESQLAETEKNFHRIHQELYKHVAEAEPTELVSLRVRVIGKQERPPLGKTRGGVARPQVVRRKVYFEDIDEFVECDSYIRSELPVGFSFNGPAIVFQTDSTSLIYSNQSATVDEYGSVIIEEKAG